MVFCSNQIHVQPWHGIIMMRTQSLSGSGTVHDTVGICYQNIPENMPNPTNVVDDVVDDDVDDVVDDVDEKAEKSVLKTFF